VKGAGPRCRLGGRRNLLAAWSVAAHRRRALQARQSSAIALLDRPVEGCFAFVIFAFGSAPCSSSSFTVSAPAASEATALMSGVLAYCAGAATAFSLPTVNPAGDSIGGCQVAAVIRTSAGGVTPFDIRKSSSQVIARKASALCERRQPVRIQTLCRPESERFDVGRSHGERERRRTGAILTAKIGAVLAGEAAAPSRCPDRRQRRAPPCDRLRARVDVRAGGSAGGAILSASGAAHIKAVAVPVRSGSDRRLFEGAASNMSAFANSVADISTGTPSASIAFGLTPLLSRRSTSPIDPRCMG